MDGDFNKAVVRRFIEGFLNTADADIAHEILAADHIDHTPSNPELTGRENIKRFVNEWLAAFPDSHSVLKEMVAEGDKVAGRWTTTATHQGQFRGASPTGKRVEVEAIGIFRIADGKVVESWDKYDIPELSYQLKLLGPLWLNRARKRSIGNFVYWNHEEGIEVWVYKYFAQITCPAKQGLGYIDSA